MTRGSRAGGLDGHAHVVLERFPTSRRADARRVQRNAERHFGIAHESSA